MAAGRAEAEVREQGSRFLAYLAPAPTAEAAGECRRAPAGGVFPLVGTGSGV